MSTSIGQYGASAASLVLSAGVKELSDAQTTLSWQTSNNGIISETFAGLGTSRSTVFSLTPKITQVAAWQSNITNAQNSLSVTATSLKQIVSLAQTMATDLLSITGTSSTSTVSSISTEASSTLSQIATVLNASNGTGYVFAGQNATQAPVNDPSNVATGTTSTQIASTLSQLASGTSVDSILEQATTLMNADSSIFRAPFPPRPPRMAQPPSARPKASRQAPLRGTARPAPMALWPRRAAHRMSAAPPPALPSRT